MAADTFLWTYLAFALAFTHPEASDQAVKLAAAVYVVALLSYYIVGEGCFGRTLGKLVTGLAVVGDNGRPPGVARAAVRTLARLVEVNPVLLGCLPAAVCVALTPARQRIGDLLAATYVLPARDAAHLR